MNGPGDLETLVSESNRGHRFRRDDLQGCDPRLPWTMDHEHRVDMASYVSKHLNQCVERCVCAEFTMSDVNFGMCGHSFGLHNHEISALAHGTRDVHRQDDRRWLQGVEGDHMAIHCGVELNNHKNLRCLSLTSLVLIQF